MGRMRSDTSEEAPRIRKGPGLKPPGPSKSIRKSFPGRSASTRSPPMTLSNGPNEIGYIGGSAENPEGTWTKTAGPKQVNKKILPWAVGKYSFATNDAQQWAE